MFRLRELCKLPHNLKKESAAEDNSFFKLCGNLYSFRTNRKIRGGAASRDMGTGSITNSLCHCLLFCVCVSRVQYIIIESFLWVLPRPLFGTSKLQLP